MRAAAFLLACWLGFGCAAARNRSPILDKHGRPTARRDAPYRAEAVVVEAAVGNAVAASEEAEDDLPGAGFEPAGFAGAGITFLFPARVYDRGRYYAARYGIEARFEEYRMELAADGFEYGRLKFNPVVAAFKFCLVPQEGTYIGFHLDFGLGYAFTSFRKDTMLVADDLANSRYTRISPDHAAVVTAGAGVDVPLGCGVQVVAGYRYVRSLVGVEWIVNDVPVPGIETFDVSGHRWSLGVQFFF